jgi:hypothetical protein
MPLAKVIDRLKKTKYNTIYVKTFTPNSSKTRINKNISELFPTPGLPVIIKL